MYVWARQMALVTRSVPQFEIRVIGWATKAPPVLDVTIVDGKAVYFALESGTTQSSRELAVEDATVAEYFRDYYETLWSTSVDLRQWLSADPPGAG